MFGFCLTGALASLVYHTKLKSWARTLRGIASLVQNPSVPVDQSKPRYFLRGRPRYEARGQ
jgi:hypothetical protein